MITEKKESLFALLQEKYYDPEFGGLYSAIDYDTTTVLTWEKQLETQALAAWGAIVGGRTEFAIQLVDYLVDSLDQQYGGIIEARERYGLVNELGNFKTTYRMLLAAYVLLMARQLPNGEKYAQHGLEIIKRVNEKAYDPTIQDYNNRLSRDWNIILDESRTPRSLSFAVLATIERSLLSGETAARQEAINYAEQLIKQHIDSDGRVADTRNHDGSIAAGAKVNLVTSSFVAIALVKMHELTNDSTYLELAGKVVGFVNGNLWDQRYTGFFTHSDLDGKITIHKEFITLLNSAIPIKTTVSNLWAFMANYMVWESSKDAALATSLQDQITYLSTMYDVRGGFFIGEGYFWTPPGTPVGPFQRLMLPSRETPGVFHFGSSSFLRLYNKHADSQAVGSLVLSYATKEQEILQYQNEVAATTTETHEVATTEALPSYHLQKRVLSEQPGTDLSKHINVEKHVKWILAAQTPGLGFGWTPNISPIGTKPNNTPSVFGTHHSISNLVVLGVKIEDKERIANWIRLCQAKNGAFGEYPGGPADVLNTYLAINLLDMMGETNFGDKEACINYLQSCQTEDGGIGVVPGFKSDLFHSNLAAVALYTLGSAPRDVDAFIRYFLSAENPDGGYGEFPGTPSDAYSVYRTVGTLALYGKAIPHPEKTLEFLKKCQGPNGGYSHDWYSRESMVATYHAVASLYLLGSQPDRLEECFKWLAGCQTPDGGFSNIPGVTTGTIDEGFAAVQSLCILEKGLSDYFAILVS